MGEVHHGDPWRFNGDDQGGCADNWADADMHSATDTMLSGVGRSMPVYIGEWGIGCGGRFGTRNCDKVRMSYQKFGTHCAAT